VTKRPPEGVPPRGIRWSPRVWLLALWLVAPACTRENPDPPDPLLQDSLGLTGEDRVVRVRLSSRDGSELVEPAQVELEPGSWVEFFTRDRRVHTVSFAMDRLAPEQAGFLRGTSQDRSPPLVELDSRFVVSFEGAPAGRYPFLVEGNGSPARGIVVVRTPERE